MSELDISNNPLSLLVSPKTIKVDPNELIVREVEQDDFFFKKYCDYLEGKIKGYITRVSISRIEPGFYKRTKNGWEHITDNPPQEDIDYMASTIRGGYRPALHIYQNLNKDSEFDFVCADDVATYHAYLSLGVSKPPVIILGSKKGLEESALTIKGFKCTYNPYTHFIFSMEKVNRDSFLSLLGADVSDDISLELTKLENYIEVLKGEFREFHSNKRSDVSYHQIIFGILARASEMLKSIRILIEEDLVIQSANIVRSLYELSLNFYMCWLSPHEITRMVQLSSVISENEWKKECDKTLKEQVANKLDRNSAEKIKEAKLYQFNITKSVIEKARLSPFGEAYYKDVYAFLSDIAHHDFSMSARYKGALEHGDDTVYDRDVKDSIVRIVDFCITKIFVRVADDIGSGITFSKDKLNKQLHDDRFSAASQLHNGA
ncbi:DUF5677 domain-containing protein [Shewanella sp. KJ2020]|uniref:DUF5677 domain-containing protein n=1 Tax=Shewanella sp. KJ2020 TaxID=2919172 RepID=UPI0020A76217|nr:DUF5677 domain-containing protein [Shewanella sp. KJ2020]MCP3130162.1 DUF5677 domain-containing protein [Shewanella sp. KJ2020]